MKKILSFLLLGMISIGMTWATDYYTPTADEVITLSGVYDAEATSNGYSTHAAVKFYSAKATFSSKKAGDPANNGAATSSNVSCFATKNNGDAKRVDLLISGVDSIIVYRENNNISRIVRLLATPEGESQTIITGTEATSSYVAHGYGLNPNKSYSIRLEGWDGSAQADVYTYAVKLFKGQTCSEPASPLTLSSNAAATIYVGDEITFSTTGGNGAAVSIEGANSETITANVWTATVGTHTFTASQAANTVSEVLYCAQESELVLTVLEQTPVTAVTVAGSEAAYKGDLVTYTATAENAAEYRWKVNGAIQAGADEATFTYNATATGTFAIVCEARNDFNAAGAWIASDAKNLVVTSIYGELVKATLTSNTAATVTGILTGTAEMALSTESSTYDEKDGYKLNSNGRFLGIKELSASLQEGDTAIVFVTTASANLQLFSDKGTTKIGELIGGVVQGENKVVLNSSATGKKAIYLYRADIDGGGSKMNPFVYSLSVVRPMPIVSEAWEGLTINDGPTSYNRTGTVVNVVDAYLDPKVVVTKHVVYADATEANVDVEVTDLEVVGNQYVGHVTIGGDVYTINIAKLASYDVTYMDGELVLGTEVVAANGHPAEFADYQNPQLATFDGWYRDADLTNPVANIASEIISANATYYAKYTKYYATSINIEQWVLDNGMSEDDNTALISLLGTQRYATNITGDLDSLNDTKASRNYDYLGLKVKKNGGLLNFRLAEGNTVKVKFGKVSATPHVSINGGDEAEMTITNKVYTYTATADALVSIKMMDGNAVVFQQIQIGANPQIAEVILPASDEFVLGANGYSTYANKFKYTVSGATAYTAVYNGSDAVTLSALAADAVIPANAGIILKGTEGETVTIMASDDDAVVIANEDNDLVGVVTPIAATEGMYVLSTNAGVTAFNPCQVGLEIPAHKAYLSIPSNAPSIIRIIENATNIENVEANEEAVKFIENGKLYIMKNGVLYNAVGAVVK